MSNLNLPYQLANPIIVSENVVSKVMLSFTAYIVGPTEQELEFLIELYESICPLDHQVSYKIGEIEYWVPISQPELTASARQAAAVGIKRPYLEPVRRRIRDGRAFDIQFWDGRLIDDPEGSWSFSCRRIHLRSKGLHAFVRFIFPLNADLQILRRVAIMIADNVDLCSGHGGLMFVYNPWFKGEALNAIYAQARRFWGIDVEDLNITLPLMNEAIKGVSWITIISHRFVFEYKMEAALGKLTTMPGVTVDQQQHGSVIIIGSEPLIGDQNRHDLTLAPYYAIANELKPLFLDHHPDFSSQLFIDNGNTIDWIRRFINPSGWR